MADDEIVQSKIGANQVRWDKNKSIRTNIEDNLNLITEGGKLPHGFAKALSSNEEAQAIIQLRGELVQWNDDVGFNAYSLSGDDSVVQKLLDDLPSHDMGLPSYLYAVLERAQYESTNQEKIKKEQAELLYSEKKAAVEREKKHFEDKIELHQNEFTETMLSLRAQNDEKERHLRELRDEEVQLSREIRQKEREIISEKKEMKLLRTESDRLEGALKSVQANSESWEKHKKQYQGMLAQKSSSDPNHLSHQSHSFRTKFFKILDGLLKRTNEQVVALASHYYDTVRPKYVEEEKRSENLDRAATEMQRLVGSIKELQEDRLGNDGVARTPALNQNDITVKPAIGELSETEQASASMVKIRKVSTAGGPKEFDWQDHQNVCSNIERLLKSYINSPGHSPGRVRSAKAVLKRAEELKKSGAEDADLQLLTFIRDQNISSRGFNKEKSLLHAIYRESERAYRSSLVQQRLQIDKDKSRLEKKWEEAKKKLDQNMSAPNPVLDAESRRSEQLSERHDKLQDDISEARSRLSALESEKGKVSQKKESLQLTVEEKRSQLKEESEKLLQLRKDTVSIGMKAHSSHQHADKKAEENFVKTNVALIEAVDAMDEKKEELQQKISSEEKKTQGMKEENDGKEVGIRDSYLRVARKNGEMGYVPEKIAVASADSLLSRVARFEEKLRTGVVQTAPEPGKENADHDMEHPQQDQGPKFN